MPLGHKYAREEKIDEQLTQSLDQIKIDDDVLDGIVSVMGSAFAENRKQREPVVSTKQKQRLEDRLEKMYMDKLDGVISDK